MDDAEPPCRNKLFDGLPSELSRFVLGFLDIAALTLLASCNRYARTHIYRECSWLWEEMDFPKLVPKHLKAKLTDDVLQSLFLRVNAIEVTKKLSIYLHNLSGLGCLSVLRGSRVLEHVHFRTWYYNGDSVDNKSMLIDTLRSMLPYKLNRVQIPGSCLDEDDEEMQIEFMHELDACKIQRLKQNQQVCDTCKIQVVTEHKDPRFPAFECAGCGKVTCRENNKSCCPPLFRCTNCHEHYCLECKVPKNCSMCNGTFCQDRMNRKLPWCMWIGHCDVCQDDFCMNCMDVKKCAACGISACATCRDDETCDVCYDTYCKSCELLALCGSCEGAICSKCPAATCNICELDFCELCTDCIAYCAVCGTTFCSSCTSGNSMACEFCCETYCNSCDLLLVCGLCGSDICSNCACAGAFFSGTWCKQCVQDDYEAVFNASPAKKLRMELI